MPSSSDSRSERAGRFATTHWSLVLAAGRNESPDSRQALAELCEAYWYPLYAHVRRRGHAEHEAQDLTQEFFAQLLEKGALSVADQRRGKFRSFLLASLDHFLANQYRRARAKKRGGGTLPISLDLLAGESKLALEPGHELTPEKEFQRRWALTLLERTLAKVRAQAVEPEKLRQFERLKLYLGGDQGAVPYRQIAAELGTSEGAVKVAVHRLRRQCRDALRAEIVQTVTRPEDVDDELRELFHAVAPAKSPNRV
ncbi:MAG TPA: sigma-70 family RNA polymerase sigma factor [Pirellulales bacterium]|jgi:RNA polymerase sigma-70 factor (ECF subfamily)|nr:sigma-70 family RNA polymerase sigma factor [Pirellulales bacterium]